MLVAAGLDRRTLIRVTGRNDRTARANSRWTISGEQVPVGATSFSCPNATGLKPGDRISIVRPSTGEWIQKLGAMEFGGGEGGGWKPGSRDIVWDRVVKSIEGETVTIDAPITTATGQEFGAGSVTIYDWPGRIENVGIENLPARIRLRCGQSEGRESFLVRDHDGERDGFLGAPG